MFDLIISLAYFAVIGANIILGLAVLFRRRPSAANFSFAVLAIFIAFWTFSTYNANILAHLRDPGILFWARMANIASFPMPALFLYFFLVFPDKPKMSAWWTALIFIPVPLLMLMLAFNKILKAVVYLPDGSLELVFGNLYGLFVIYFVSYLLLSFLIMIGKCIRLKGVARIQIRYVLLGTTAPIIISSLTHLFLPLFKVTYAWHEYHMIGTLSPIFFTVVVASAIVQHRFMDLRVMVGKSIVYSLMAGFITTLYFGFLYVIARSFQVLSGNYSSIIIISLFFLFALIFEPLKNKLERWVDRLFFKTKLDYEKTLKETSAAMGLISDRDRLLKLTAGLVKRRMSLSGVALFLFDEQKNSFVSKVAEGSSRELFGSTISRYFPIVDYMEKTKKPLLKYELERRFSDRSLAMSEALEIKSVLSDFEKLRSILCVPSILKDKMLAFLCLGPKLSEDPFTVEDVDFLITLANQSAIFIENTALLERERKLVKIVADAEAKEKYTEKLEETNKKLMETRQEALKSEMLSAVTMLAISLQHEINNSFTSVMSQAQALLMKMDEELGCLSESSIKERIKIAEKEIIRIRDLLSNLGKITEPIIKQYMPSTNVKDINASTEEQGA